MSDSIVIIPTYNEKENVEKIIRKVFSLSPCFHVLIIDDGSPDGTADIVRGLQSEFTDKLFLEQRIGKLGLGTAYIHGFRWALTKSYEYIFEMDADFSHNPKDLIRLRAACMPPEHAGVSQNPLAINPRDTRPARSIQYLDADVAIGSRYIKGVNVVNWPMGRVLMSYFASKYVRIITGISVRDATAGFKCYRRKVLETIPLDKIRFIGYAFQIEMKFTAIKYGFKVVEIPIIFTDRTEGTSKMSTRIFSEAFFGVLQIKINSWFRKYT